MIRTVSIACALLFALAVPAKAGPFEDGVAAAEREDYATALKLWRPLAEQGDAKAQTNLGLMYSGGIGVPQDYAEAVKWFRKATDQGDADAQTILGLMYSEGIGVPQDYAEAVKWFRKAADQGDADTQFNLGMMYYNGKGLPQDFVQAHMWVSIAAASDNDYTQYRDTVAKKMTPDQIAEAQRMAREWMAKHPQ